MIGTPVPVVPKLGTPLGHFPTPTPTRNGVSSAGVPLKKHLHFLLAFPIVVMEPHV